MIKDNSTRTIIAGVIIITFVFFLHFIGVLKPLESALSVVVRPIVSSTGRLSAGIASIFDNWQSREKLSSVNERLRQENLELQLQKAEFMELRDENNFLRGQMNFFEEKNYQYISGRVIGRGTEKLFNTIIIGLGSQHGVKAGAPVLAGDGVLIGKISETNLYTSQVLLLNSDLSKVGAKILSDEKIIGLVEGAFGLGMKMRFISQQDELRVGDLSVTSGLEDMVPPGILIGRVSAIEKEPEALFQEATVVSPLDFNKIDLISVIIGQNENSDQK